MPVTMTRIRIVDVIGSPIAVSTAKAQKLYKLIADKLSAGEDVELSFDGVQNIITAFLNTAVGQLYSKFSEKQLRSRLHVADATPEIRSMVKKTTDNAKRFFRNPEPYRRAHRQLTGHDAL